MKTSNKKKIVVSTLALAMGAALAGSISGSVAWYQYSTRAAASLTGTSAGTSRELQIKEGTGEWGQYVNLGSADYSPVTPKTVADQKVTAFSGHPVYQYSSLPDATGTEYLQKTLNFQVLDANKTQTTPTAVSGKNIYLTKLEISGAIADLVRVAIKGTGFGYIFATSGTSTVTQGNLDLNGNDADDKSGLDQTDTSGDLVTYGTNASYTHTAMASVVEFTDAYTPGAALQVGTTGTDAELTLQVWLEGWALFNSSASWDIDDTLAKSFSVNLRFEVAAEA